MPDTQYAKSGDVHVAYQVWGDGPLNLVFVPRVDLTRRAHVGGAGERAGSSNGCGAFATVAFFDKRGTGLSDPVPVHELPTLEQRMDDARAVMDAAGMEKAALLGISEGGAMGVLFAAHLSRAHGGARPLRLLGPHGPDTGLSVGAAARHTRISPDQHRSRLVGAGTH